MTNDSSVNTVNPNLASKASIENPLKPLQISQSKFPSGLLRRNFHEAIPAAAPSEVHSAAGPITLTADTAKP